ncbi:hypothetical protein BGZ73_000522 [Actinomortierella ambigua]|nr:hypothetical protein BGZ73_000522 [Actinomortierella ambigua]
MSEAQVMGHAFVFSSNSSTPYTMATAGGPPTSSITQPHPSSNTAGPLHGDVAARGQQRAFFKFRPIFTHPSLGHLASVLCAKHGSYDLVFPGSILYQLNADDDQGDFVYAVIQTFPPKKLSTIALANIPFLNIHFHRAKTQIEMQFQMQFTDEARITPIRFNNREIFPIHPAPEGTISRFILTNYELPRDYNWQDHTLCVDYVTRLLTQRYDVGEVIKVEQRLEGLDSSSVEYFGVTVVYTYSAKPIDGIERKVPHSIPEDLCPPWKLRTKDQLPLLVDRTPACQLCHQAGHKKKKKKKKSAGRKKNAQSTVLE